MVELAVAPLCKAFEISSRRFIPLRKPAEKSNHRRRRSLIGRKEEGVAELPYSHLGMVTVEPICNLAEARLCRFFSKVLGEIDLETNPSRA